MPKIPRPVIFTAQYWKSNAHLIADVANFGYLDGLVLDATWGLGNFWDKHEPEGISMDKYTQADIKADFTAMPFASQTFDSVVFDPPYKLNGTPSEADVPYGVHFPTRWQDRMELMFAGLSECCRVSRRYVLVKCMDQVVSGKKVWQTNLLTNYAFTYESFELVDRFDLLRTPRPQPPGRRRVHSQANYSTLLVMERS